MSCSRVYFPGRCFRYLHCYRIQRLNVEQKLNLMRPQKKFFSIDKEKIIVSIIGPPNAGKSTLFNSLMCKESNRSYRLMSEKNKHGKRKVKLSGRVASNMSKRKRMNISGGAIVSPIPGTTRDKRECIGRIGGTYFTLYDTAGLDSDRIEQLIGKGKDELKRDMTLQTLQASKESDLILLMFDAKIGVTPDLIEIIRWLRKNNLKKLCSNGNGNVILLANKLEGNKWAVNDLANGEKDGKIPVLEHLLEANILGFGDSIPISAEHGEGISDIALIIENLQKEKNKLYGNETDGDNKEKPLQLAVLGRQNVGKSTLVNTLLNYERVITGPLPGLTRDAISVVWTWNNRPVKVFDTAGLRKISSRNHIDGDIEDQAVNDAIRAMKTADVAIIVIDAQARYIAKQELAIADAVLKEGRVLVIVANKMDLIVQEDYTKTEFANAVQEQLTLCFPFLRLTPVIPMSSLTGENVEKLMPVVFKARDRWQRTISTGLLNQWLNQVTRDHPPPAPIKIKYILQSKGRPPTFLLFSNSTDIPPTYLRYLRRNFQDSFEMFGMEVRLSLKKVPLIIHFIIKRNYIVVVVC